MGDYFRRFWLPVLLSQELPEPRRPARARAGAGRGPRRLPRHRRPRRAASTRAARTAAPTCSSGATRSAACAARTTAGSSTSTAAASTCRRCRRESGFRDTRAGSRAYPDARVGRLRLGVPRPARARAAAAGARVRALPPSHRFVSKKLQQCNWAQACEGALDTAHFSFLHMPVWSARRRRRRAPCAARRSTAAHALDARRPAPGVHGRARTTSASSPAPPARPTATTCYWRIAQFLLPNHALTPERVPGREHPRADLGADHRRALLGLLLHVESGPAAHRGGAPRIPRRAAACTPRWTSAGCRSATATTTT